MDWPETGSFSSQCQAAATSSLWLPAPCLANDLFEHARSTVRQSALLALFVSPPPPPPPAPAAAAAGWLFGNVVLSPSN